MAYGRLGWSEEKFFSSEVQLFFKALKGFNDLENERELKAYKQIRILVYRILAPHAKERLTVQDLLPLPGDDELIKRDKKDLERLKKDWEHLDKL